MHHEAFGNPTIADAVLDRLVHNAHRIELTGDSLRRRPPEPPSITACPRTEPKSPSLTTRVEPAGVAGFKSE